MGHLQFSYKSRQVRVILGGIYPVLHCRIGGGCEDPLMDVRQRIRRYGLRKWYERELIQSHAHLVLLLLCTLALLASAEVYASSMPLADQVMVGSCAVVSAALGLWALRRYLYLLSHAEHVADQAVCPRCSTYARLDLRDDAGSKDALLQVRCRHCGEDWSIEL